MKKLLTKIATCLGIFVAILLGVTIALTRIKDGTWSFNVEYLKSGQATAIAILLFGLIAVFYLINSVDGKKKSGDKAVDKVRDEKGNEVKQFFSKDFVTENELKTEKGFNYNTLSTIRSCKKDGILVRAEENGNKMDINFVEPIHTLVVGTTSSGKTSRFVVPSLQIMSMTAAKPSFVITDPKAELYDKCYNKFIQEGYDVKVVNLRDPFASVLWNPLTYPYDLYHRSFNLEKEVKVHEPGDDPKKYNIIIQRPFDHNSQVWFEFNGIAYADQDLLENDMKVIARKCQDDAYTALNDICVTLAPIENTKDASWERTAQRLIHAVMLAMLEDSADPQLNLTREKYNLYNVAKICNTTDSGRETYATLKKYLFDYRDKFSKVHDLASTALNNADNTSKNYMGFVSSKTAMFSDTGISFMTSNTEIDFVDIDEKPTAVFLIIPDEIRTRYPLAVLFVDQLYKRLVEKAASIGGELKRHVYFMLDEFGNMPKFPDFGVSMAVGRSRGIFFELCVQSYNQLHQIYGQEEGNIIKENCPTKVYINTDDSQTNKEFSELLGKKTVVITNENKSKNPDGKDSTSTSKQVQSIPIAYPEELMSFRDKELIVIKTLKPNAALKTKISNYYTSKIYDKTKVYGSYVQRRMFDENAVFFDIKERNKILAGQNDDDDDDDDLF